MKRQLNDEILEKQQILSTVSHDIKSPFNRISALEQLIVVDGNPLSDDQKDYLDKIHQVVADGLGLIRNLVDFRNLQYRRLEIVPEEIDLSALVHMAVKRHVTLAGKKGITFSTEIADGVRIHSDNVLVTRVVDNILSNAIKFSPLTKTIEVRLREGGDEARIEIKDEAPGFTGSDISKMYRKFQKLSAKPTAGESTTGLGLYISKAMLSKIGGKIQCVSTEGKGSTFIVSLPYQLSLEG